ncbi:hypothetical protein LCGC14_1672800 [marine sediment metagenome]|uniref:Uncharacterized protein n=1 Tax=marine sediment metagenome TaxID=412755 RepID=A0A0F9HQU4_9ZZZZ
MFEEIIRVTILIFPLMGVIGYFVHIFISKKAFNKELGYFSPIINILAFIGVAVHEFSHQITCIIVGMPTKGFSVAFRDRFGRVNPHGHVIPDRLYQSTLMQILLVSLAPLLIGTWLVYFSLMVAFSPLFEPIYRIVAVVFCISVILAITPSTPDIRLIGTVYKNDPEYSLYQIFLVALFFLALWASVDILHWYFPLEYLYYFFLILCYYAFKYIFKGIRLVYSKITIKKEKYKPKRFRRFARRRFRPRRIRFEEVGR